MRRFITKTIHSYLDYPVAVGLIAMPILFGLGATNPLAFWLSVLTGVAAFVLTLLTDHDTGVIPLTPYSVHLFIDSLVALGFLVAPFAFGFTGMDALYYWVIGATVLAVVGLHEPEQDRLQAV